MSRSRWSAVLVALLCLLALPSTASAIKFEAPAAGASITDSSVRANALVSADFDGDGLDDIAAGRQKNGIQIRLANGDGSWTTGPTVSAGGPGAYSVATGDFNEDGKPDLVEADYSCGNSVPPECTPQPSPAVLLGNGDGSFGLPININGNLNSPANFNAITVGDADTDGNLDVIIGMDQGEYGIAYGNGNGGFVLAQRTQIPGAPHGPGDDAASNTVGDFNGDGDNDIAIAIRNKNDLSLSAIYLLLGDGARNFTASSNNPFTAGQPTGYIDSIKSADFDQDGNDDLAATLSGEADAPASLEDGSIQVWNGDEDEGMVANPLTTILVASQNPGAPIPDQVGPSNLRLGDFDTDGRVDLAWFEYFQPNGPRDYRLVVARNTGGSFATNVEGPWNFPGASGDPKGLAIGDFNGDGAPDAAMSAWGNGTSGGLFFLENRIDLSGSPEALDFGDVVKGGDNEVRQVQIRNSGGPDARIDQVTLTGTDAAKFSVDSYCADQVISAVAGCTQQVGFYPNLPRGEYSANLQITFDGTSETLNIPVSAKVVAPVASFDTRPLEFGEVRKGQSRDLTETVTSSGDAPLTFEPGISVEGADKDQFSIQSDTCSGVTLDPGETCAVTVRAAPTTANPVYNAYLDIPNDGIVNNGVESYDSITLRMQGIDPQLTVNPTSWDFGSANVGGGISHTFQINSTGPTSLGITDLSIAGTNAGDFELAQDHCSPTVPAGTSCEFIVSFVPTDGGTRSGEVRISTNAGEPVVINLTGTANKPGVELDSEEIDFGDVNVGESLSRIVTATSTGTSPIEIEGAEVGGPHEEDNTRFSVSDDTCTGSTLAVGETCSYKITFSPGARRDYLSYTGVFGSNTWAEAELTGSGVQPGIQADVRDFDFGPATIGAGDIRPSHTFTFTSSGLDPLTIDSLTIDGPDADSFKLDDPGACLKSLAPNEKCQVTVSFDPDSGNPGDRRAVLGAATDAGEIEVDLTGTAEATVIPPDPTYQARLKLTGPKKVKAGRKFKLKAVVANTGTGDLSGLSLKWKATQGKKVKKQGKVKLATLVSGEKLTRRLVIAIRKKKLNRGMPVKVTVTLIRQSKTLATSKVRIRQEFGPANPGRRYGARHESAPDSPRP